MRSRHLPCYSKGVQQASILVGHEPLELTSMQQEIISDQQLTQRERVSGTVPEPDLPTDLILLLVQSISDTTMRGNISIN